MANFQQNVEITGVLDTTVSQNISQPRYIWIDSTNGKLMYSATSGSSIVIKEAGNSVPT